MADTWNNWQAVANALIPACTDVVSSVARNGAGEVRNTIASNGQVLTGNMLKSVYASTPQSSDYKSDIERGLPEEKPTSDTEAVIAVSADYAIFPEMGTVHQPPRPFFAPAMDRVAVDFAVGLEDIAKRLEDAAK